MAALAGLVAFRAAHRHLRRRDHARLARAHRRPRPDAGPATGDRHLHGHRLPRPGHVDGHRGDDRRRRELARRVHRLRRRRRRDRRRALRHYALPARPSCKGDPHSEFLRPYGGFSRHGPSLRTYLVVFVEGLLILGSFSYAGAYADKALGLETFGIGLLMAVFGVGVIGGSRLSGRLARAHRPAPARGRWASVSRRLPTFFSPRLARISRPLPSRSCCSVSASCSRTRHSSRRRPSSRRRRAERRCRLSPSPSWSADRLGTMLGGRIILGASYRDLYLSFGVALVALGVVAMLAVPAQGSSRVSVATPPPAAEEAA